MNFTVISNTDFKNLSDKIDFLTEKLKNNQAEEILTVKETADFLKVSVQKVKKYCDNKILTKRVIENGIRFYKSEVINACKIIDR